MSEGACFNQTKSQVSGMWGKNGQALWNIKYWNGILFSISNHQRPPVLDPIFTVHCYITNSPTLEPENSPYISLHGSVGQKSCGVGSAGLCSKHRKVKIKVLTGLGSFIWRPRKRTHSQPLQGVDKIRATWGPTPSASFQLRIILPGPTATHIPSHEGLPSSNGNNRSSPSYILNFSDFPFFPLLPLAGECSLLLAAMWLD